MNTKNVSFVSCSVSSTISMFVVHRVRGRSTGASPGTNIICTGDVTEMSLTEPVPVKDLDHQTSMSTEHTAYEYTTLAILMYSVPSSTLILKATVR